MRASSGTYRLPRARSKTGTGNGPSEQASEFLFSIRSFHLRILMQCVFCIASLVLGVRITQEANLVRVHFLPVEGNYNHSADVRRWSGSSNQNTTGGLKSNRVYVGRHPILVRPWPHPDPVEVVQAYNLIARVQREQRRLYGVKDWKPIIAITPTYVRTFQAVHLSGLMHTLSLVRGPVTWIVVESGGVSTETAALLSQAHVHKLVHLGSSKPMPTGLGNRRIVESHLRVEGLRYVREQKLQGLVVFADDSNVYSMDFFDEVQKVKWVGALPVGVLGQAGFGDLWGGLSPPSVQPEVQGPVCSSGKVNGWHAVSPVPSMGKGAMGEERRLEWAGFILNAWAVWASEVDRPDWIKDWTAWARPIDDVFIEFKSILRDENQVEVLENCGFEKPVLLWWLRMEARADSKFPSMWTLDMPLEIIVSARRTPWPDRVFPPPSPPPPPGVGGLAMSGQSGKRKGGNRSTGREMKPKRSRRRPIAMTKGSVIGNAQKTVVTNGTQT